MFIESDDGKCFFYAKELEFFAVEISPGAVGGNCKYKLAGTPKFEEIFLTWHMISKILKFVHQIELEKEILKKAKDVRSGSGTTEGHH